MKKKTAKQTLPTPEFNSQRETRVLLEEMNKGIKTIGEQYGTIAKKLEEHDGRFDKIESELTTVKSELNTVKMAVMENSEDIKELKAGQEEIKQKLDAVAANHEHRLQKLEMAQ